MPIDDQETFTIAITGRYERVKKWVIAYGGSANYSTNQIYMAEHFDLINMTFTYPNAASIIKSYNPDIKLIAYQIAAEFLSSYGDWNIVNGHEDWFMHTIYGEELQDRVRGCYYRDYKMNISPVVGGYSDYYANKALGRLTTWPQYDGIFGDNCIHLRTSGLCDMNLNPISGSDVPQDVWDGYNGPDHLRPDSWMVQHIQNAKNTIGADKIFMNNSGRDFAVSAVSGWHCWEGFCHNYIHDLTSPGHDGAYQLVIMREMESVMQTGIDFAVITGTGGVVDPDNMTPEEEATVHQWMINTYCTFCLIIDNPDKSWYSFSVSGYSNPTASWWPEMDTEIGMPLEQMHLLTGNDGSDPGVYVRHFENATIAANVSSKNEYDVTLDGIEYHFGIKEGKILPP